MNFLIRTNEGEAVARPDSTRNKDKGELFVHPDINTVGYTPVVYARLCKTGKMIGGEFAQRYYDAVAFGVLLYPSPDSDDAVSFRRDTGAIHDKSSLLPLEMYSPMCLENSGKVFSIELDGENIYRCNTLGLKATIADALVCCSSHTTIHKGDLVISELEGIAPLHRRNDGDCRLTADFCEEEIIDIELKF